MDKPILVNVVSYSYKSSYDKQQADFVWDLISSLFRFICFISTKQTNKQQFEYYNFSNPTVISPLNINDNYC